MIRLRPFPSRLVVALAAWAGPVLAVAPQDPETAARRDALHAAGVAAPLVLHPIVVLGRPDSRVAEALGLVLEKQGMSDLDVAAVPFAPPKDTKWDDVPALFGAHVAALGGEAAKRHHLYAEFLGTPKTGPEEVRFVVADGAGHVVIVDRQTPADAAFKRTAAKDPDPLGCSMLVADRLFALADWKKAPGSVRDGKFAKGWKDRSGVPDQKEFAAMKARLATMRDTIDKARVVVLPTIAAGGHDGASAARLAEAIGREFGCRAEAKADGAKLAVAPDSNEQKRLWDLARALKSSLAKAPAANADYVLAADLGVDAEGGHCYLHVVVTTATGEFVLVDFQNDQSPAVSKAMPKALADAESLLVARLGALLR
ncbi:MAG: hypothetical protein JNK78_19725 [Planctomycetes bacterium]|nr:hypothetical protein [Planctomycetota bacterium]